MNAASSAYVTCVSDGKTMTWHFTGVTSIEHNLSLNMSNTASQGTDIVNGARNQSSQVVLSVVETDVEHASGWAAEMLAALSSVKKDRTLCRVVTSMGTYDRMLLTEIAVTQDEENQYGWSGSLTFREYIPSDQAGDTKKKTNTNSSVRNNTGSSGSGKKITGTVFQQLLQRAGAENNS